jgi:uncharacterized protein YjiS (DUF1127 family)
MSTMKTISGSFGHIETRQTNNWFLALLSDLVLVLQAMAEKSRSRRALSALSDDQLKDIGLSRSDAFREGQRPFWD